MRRFRRFPFFLWYISFCFGMILALGSLVSAAEQEVYDAHGKRDPFVPLVTSTMRSSSSGLL